MAFFGRIGNIIRNAANAKISSEIKLRSFPSVFQAIRCFSSVPSTKLFVGGVSYSTDEQSLREVFARYGEVVDVRIIMDRETGRSKGFGFITYNTVEEASSALQALDGQDLHGRRVGVNFANERARGGYGGGDGGFGGSYGNTSYGGGGGVGYQGGYGNSPYGAAPSGGGYGDAGGNVTGGYGSTYNDGTTSGGYGGNNANYGAPVSGGESNTLNYGSAPAVGGYGGGNNGNYGAADTVNYGSAPGAGGYGGDNASYGGGESNSVNYGSAPGVGGYGSGSANYGAAVGGVESNSVNYGSPPVDGGYGASSVAAAGTSNGFTGSQYPGNATGYGSGSLGTGSSFAGGYGESGQENFRNDDHEADAFAKRA
ncbi:glycine-rich RNA-binding protein 3, mitochondrial-like [Vicia villosa]|uniref:glycine-rich RNA-binding protein 3, mitochondrial-like n=1 Tax=Vicia villosa TaxID=3911 RepID=UPI00273AB220|nr:glycine-rich RNA-binding protein 3, mitochondrial-like [Vicia villosa]